jgi:hypothetical protein
MSQQLQDLIAGSGAMNMQQIGLGPFVVLMAVSLVCSLLVSLLYVQFYASRATGSQVHRAFPLLGISITAIFVCIQFSLPLSLGLLGALSIVRFRTPIKEPEEVGFIMLVIAVSIATATFKLAFVGLLLVVALVALLVQTRAGGFSRRRADGTLVVTVPDAGVPAREGAISEAVRRHVASARLESLVRQDGLLVLSYAFRGMASATPDALQAELPAAAPGVTYSLYFSRPDAR